MDWSPPEWSQCDPQFTVSHDPDLVDFLGNVPAPAEPKAPTGPTPADRAGRALDKLRPREARAVRLRFGFDGEARTLEVVGQEMKVSKERARQLIGKGIERLREGLATA